jgi:hypothetical protein
LTAAQQCALEDRDLLSASAKHRATITGSPSHLRPVLDSRPEWGRELTALLCRQFLKKKIEAEAN